MLKRILIVLFWVIAIMVVPYLAGKFLTGPNFAEKTIFLNWTFGIIICVFAAGGIVIIFALYSMLCLVWDYIIGKK